MNKSVTTEFVEQPLALSGAAKLGLREIWSKKPEVKKRIRG